MDDRWLPQIDPLRCSGCALCIAACPNGVLAMAAGVAAVARPDACQYTGNCELACPDDAIHLFYLIEKAAAEAPITL